tara:strand:+ start:221 stop:640 length:420 start_codon:yes stop_codon:yes gene_type:complete
MFTRTPSDQEVLDQIFLLSSMPGFKDAAWLLSLVATYGKTPEELSGFTWNEDDSINIDSKKKPIKPLHPQWAIILQIKERQPSRLKGRWKPLTRQLEMTLKSSQIQLTINHFLAAHEHRRINDKWSKRHAQESDCLVAA